MKISVCMAVYNGAAHLLPQMHSILTQLREDDELVIVDDASQDESEKLLRSLSDTRLHVHRNEKNLGVLATFEKGLRLAQGDIVFLSDQDDLWLPGKVDKIIAVFSLNPEITLVVSDPRSLTSRVASLPSLFLRSVGALSRVFYPTCSRTNISAALWLFGDRCWIVFYPFLMMCRCTICGLVWSMKFSARLITSTSRSSLIAVMEAT